MQDRGYLLRLNGEDISSFKVILGGVEKDWKEEHSSLGEYESVTSQAPLSPFKRNHGGRYTDTLKRPEISFIYYDPFQSNSDIGLTQDVYAEFQDTYFNKPDFLKLEFPDHPTLKNYYYMAKLLNPQEMIVNGRVLEVRCDIECDSPYGYLNDEYEATFTSVGSYIINCTSHQDGVLSPSIKIQGNGTISILNATNGSGFVVNVKDGETVTVDDFHYVSSSDLSIPFKLVDCDMSQYKFLTLDKGVNKIEILSTNTIKQVEISYPICKKIGW